MSTPCTSAQGPPASLHIFTFALSETIPFFICGNTPLGHKVRRGDPRGRRHIMRAHLRQNLMRYDACSAPQRYCLAVAHPPTVRELAVNFLKDHKAGKTLKLDRAVVAAADDDQHLVEELRAAVWAAAPKAHLKVIHGVGHRQTKVVVGVPYTDHNGTVKKVTHSVKDVLVGGVPFIASKDVQRGVRIHVGRRALSDDETKRVDLWCNSGCAGSGKSTLLAHNAAAAVLEQEAKVLEAVGSDEAALWLHRPLGFLVSFNSTATPLSDDSAFPKASSGLSFMLTRIALRMLYSLCGVAKPESLDDLKELVDDSEDVGGVRRTVVEAQPQDQSTVLASFASFVDPFRAATLRCDDTKNFDAIVSAIRVVLEWEGPLFLAVDEFAAPSLAYDDVDLVRHDIALDSLSRYVKDTMRRLNLSWGGREAPLLYSQCCIVSVCHGVNLRIQMYSSNRGRGLIQPMPVISVAELLNGYAQMSNTAITRLQLPTMYSRLLHPSQRPERLSIEQYLFLAEVALTRGHPREVQRVVAAYSAASGDGRFVVPSGDVVANLEGVSCSARLKACKLVAGLWKGDFFNDGSKDAQELPFFNEAMEQQRKFTSSKPARVLASAQFLRSVSEGWAPCNDSCDWWIRHYMATLSTWLQAQADRDAGFVSIGALLVAPKSGASEADEEGTALSGNRAEVPYSSARCAEVALPDDHVTYYHHHGHDTNHVDAGGHNKKKPNCSVGRKMTALWLRSGSRYFGQLTFRALALRLACVLRTNRDRDRAVITAEQGAAYWEAEVRRQQRCASWEWELRNVLKGPAHIPWIFSLDGVGHVQLRGGALREIDVRNFPSMFNNVHGADARLRAHLRRPVEENVRHAVDTEHVVAQEGASIAERLLAQSLPDEMCCELSAEALRGALALGDHFCFRPRNCGDHGPDSVFFLRAASRRPEWVVLMLQRTQSPKERSGGSTAAGSTRRSTDLLFSVLEDTSGAEHSLKYVRVLVAASAVNACMPAEGR